MTFEFHPLPRIQFGAGQFDNLPEVLRPVGPRILIIHNADTLIPRLTSLLKDLHLVFHRQRGEPTTDDVERAVTLAKRERIDCLLALGGGSAIDCAKATAALLTNQGSPLDYMEVVGRGKKIQNPSAPWIAIPTTAGTGAEATRNAVIALSPPPPPHLSSPLPRTRGRGQGEGVVGCSMLDVGSSTFEVHATEEAPSVSPASADGLPNHATRMTGQSSTPFKASIRSEHLLPRLILIDPALHLNLPPAVTARSGMDALSQCIESYTSTHANPLTDPLALQGISLCARSLKNCYENGNDINARQDMALAALLSGISLTNAGLGAVHGFAAPLGAHFPIPHGLICAALLPHVIAANIAALRTQNPDHPTLLRYATIGRTLAGDLTLPAPDALRAAIDATHRLNADLHIPSLSSFNFTAADVPAMGRLARQASSMRFNPVVLPDEALGAILSAAIEYPGEG